MVTMKKQIYIYQQFKKKIKKLLMHLINFKLKKK